MYVKYLPTMSKIIFTECCNVPIIDRQNCCPNCGIDIPLTPAERHAEAERKQRIKEQMNKVKEQQTHKATKPKKTRLSKDYTTTHKE